jgi:biopolymer transport protein ExbB/TolQ
MLNQIIDFYIRSHPVTLVVLAILALYFFTINWVFFYRLFQLNTWITKENRSFETLLMGAGNVAEYSFLNNFVSMGSAFFKKELFDLANFAATKESTKGLTLLSTVASTSPFIGLFGTVVSILSAFSHIGKNAGMMSIIASGVSDALVATACGIFVAIFAYTYHQILKRKAFELSGLLQMQSDSLLARRDEE